MDLLDVNVLIHAYRTDAPRHSEYKEFLETLIDNVQTFAIPSIVFSGFFRIVTNRRAFKTPSPFSKALEFAERLHALPYCETIVPGTRHWQIFTQICQAGNAQGSAVSDAYLAAMAIENGYELVTADRGFGRWPGLKWRHPLGD